MMMVWLDPGTTTSNEREHHEHPDRPTDHPIFQGSLRGQVLIATLMGVLQLFIEAA
jgi:hypothetical protein